MPSWWNKEENRVNGWIAAVYSILSIAAMLGIIFAFTAGIWGLKVATAGIYGRGEARIQIQSATFRIAAYELFFGQCAGIQANEAQIDSLALTLDTEELSQRTREIMLTQLTGVRAARLGAIADYNLDAERSWTVGQFRDEDLVFKIPATEYPQGGKTICIVSEQ